MTKFGELCPDCGRLVLELSCGGTRSYCWWCEERAGSSQNA